MRPTSRIVRLPALLPRPPAHLVATDPGGIFQQAERMAEISRISLWILVACLRGDGLGLTEFDLAVMRQDFNRRMN